MQNAQTRSFAATSAVYFSGEKSRGSADEETKLLKIVLNTEPGPAKWYSHRYAPPVNFIKNVIWGMFVCSPRKSLLNSIANAYGIELIYAEREGRVSKGRAEQFVTKNMWMWN